MKILGKAIIGVGDWFSSLSDRARLGMAILSFLLLLSWSCVKLIASWSRLNDPLPRADPEKVIKPMQELFIHPQLHYEATQQNRDFARLDSLAKIHFENAKQK